MKERMEVDLARVPFVPPIKVGRFAPSDGDDSGAVDGWGSGDRCRGIETHAHTFASEAPYT